MLSLENNFYPKFSVYKQATEIEDNSCLVMIYNKYNITDYRYFDINSSLPSLCCNAL